MKNYAQRIDRLEDLIEVYQGKANRETLRKCYFEGHVSENEDRMNGVEAYVDSAMLYRLNHADRRDREKVKQCEAMRRRYGDCIKFAGYKIEDIKEDEFWDSVEADDIGPCSD